MTNIPDPHPPAEYPEEEGFWEFLDRLVASSRLVVDRPRGTAHPRYPDLLYTFDYGYLNGTQAIDGGGIDFWMGSLTHPLVSGILCNIDLLKRDAEVKILFGCAQADISAILDFTKDSSMRAVFLPRTRADSSF
jgi:inorganic pyrophosphatase